MVNYTAKVIREGLSFGESPRWHDGRLWYSDFYRQGVFSMDEGGWHERLEQRVLAQPSGLGWMPDGDLLCVSATDHRILRFSSSGVSTYASIGQYCGYWANDMIVSQSGHSYVGNFGFDLHAQLRTGRVVLPAPTTNLVVVDPVGRVIQVVPDMSFPNGAVISSDSATLIVAETMTCTISAFHVNVDGTLSDRRVWAQLDFVFPDGMCLDADGQVWIANAITNQCLRVREGGEITATVTTTQTSFACMLGGEDRLTLYVMTAPSSDPREIADVTLAKVETATVDVPGAGLP